MIGGIASAASPMFHASFVCPSSRIVFIEQMSVFALSHGFSLPLICALLFPSGPSAISEVIIAIIVGSFDSVFWGRFQSHISQECLEGHSPPPTHCNSASAVVCESLLLRVVTTSQHASPTSVFGCRRAVSRTVPMLKHSPCTLRSKLERIPFVRFPATNYAENPIV